MGLIELEIKGRGPRIMREVGNSAKNNSLGIGAGQERQQHQHQHQQQRQQQRFSHKHTG